MRYETKITKLTGQTGSANDNKTMTLTFTNSIDSVQFLYLKAAPEVFRVISTSVSGNVLTVNIRAWAVTGYTNTTITLLATVATY